MNRLTLLSLVTLAVVAITAGIGCKDKAKKRAKAAALQAQRKAEAIKRAQMEAERRKHQAAQLKKMRLNRNPVGITKKTKDKEPAPIIAACVKQRGGLKKLVDVKTVRAKHHVKGPLSQRLQVTIQFPDRLLLEHLGKDGKVSHGILLNGPTGFHFSATRKTKKMSGTQVAAMKKEV